MITPEETQLVLRHFDCIDQLVSRRTTRKRPWLEVAITSYLCDLLDEETQKDETLPYPIERLNRDLAEADGLVNLSLSVETHEYPTKLERWVTQADIGLVLKFENHIEPRDSWARPWLLQAKRVYPDSQNPTSYSETSHVRIESEQHRRLLRINQVLESELARYLLYAPRPEFLDTLTRRKLSYLRRRSLAGNIFDFTLGLTLHGELKDSSTLAAGVFVTSADDVPRNLGQIHRSALDTALPFSWFIVSHFFSSGPGTGQRGSSVPNGPRDWVRGVVEGDSKCIDRLVERLGEDASGAWPVLPRHTLTIEFGIGTDLDPELRRMRIES